MRFIVMSENKAAPVSEQPSATLDLWRLLENRSAEGGTARYLAGVTREVGKLRITTPLREWDLAGLRAVTSSGRAYALAPVAEAGHHDEGFMLQVRVLAAANDCVDVTDAVVARGGYWGTHDA